jgi:hypothetical protein
MIMSEGKCERDFVEDAEGKSDTSDVGYVGGETRDALNLKRPSADPSKFARGAVWP